MTYEAYKQGCETAISVYGKFAYTEEPEEESHTVRNLAMAGAAAAPFAGLIGQQPLIHDPHLNRKINRFKTMADLSREAQPGDVLLTSKPHGSVWKTTIAPMSGSEFYHVQPVVGRRGGEGTTVSAGDYVLPENLEGIRREGIGYVGNSAEKVRKAMREGDYVDALLMRPKQGLTPQQIKAFSDENIIRSAHPYSDSKAIGTWFRDTFLPKIKGVGEKATLPVCEGNVCSTMPAMSYKNIGVDVVPGKGAKDVFPPDFMRSENFVPVGARLSTKYTMSPQMRKAMPYLSRAGIGAALAAAIYGASASPAAAIAPLGAISGGMLADAVAKRYGHTLPGFLDFAGGTSYAENMKLKNILKNFGTKATAVGLGATGAYLGAKAFQRHLAKKKLEEKLQRE